MLFGIFCLTKYPKKHYLKKSIKKRAVKNEATEKPRRI